MRNRHLALLHKYSVYRRRPRSIISVFAEGVCIVRPLGLGFFGVLYFWFIGIGVCPKFGIGSRRRLPFGASLFAILGVSPKERIKSSRVYLLFYCRGYFTIKICTLLGCAVKAFLVGEFTQMDIHLVFRTVKIIVQYYDFPVGSSIYGLGFFVNHFVYSIQKLSSFLNQLIMNLSCLYFWIT